MPGECVCSDVMQRDRWYVKHKLNYSLPCSLIVGSTDSRNGRVSEFNGWKYKLKHAVWKVSKLDLEAFWCWRMLFELHVKEDSVHFCAVNYFIWPRSTAARLLRSWVRIPLEVCVFVLSVVLSGRGLCDGLITRPEESYRLWRVVVCDQETSYARGL